MTADARSLHHYGGLTTAETQDRGSIIVVGGGISGLTTAFFLARQGVRVTLIERHPSTAIMPQARAFNARSLEIFRAYGLEEEIRERESILADMPEMLGAETLVGEERFRVNVFDQARPVGISPTDLAMIDQDELERIVRARAESAGVEVRFASELSSFDEVADGVRATVRDVGSAMESEIRADYMVAADGNLAGIRRTLGIGADGPGVLNRAAHFIFEADLTDTLRERRFLLAYLDQPTAGTVLVPMSQPGRWMLGVPFQEGESIADFTEDRCVELARAAVGVPGLELTLVPPVPGWSQMLMEVRIGAMVASRFRVGRVFFVGDSAHVVPPSGSFGANTGIADAHNLAWKLASVLHGVAGAELLDTYEDERRPVALTTMETALQIMEARHHAEGEDAAKIDEVAMTYGYRYRSTAVNHEPGTPDGPVEDPRIPTGRPELRAPHVRLQRADTTLSTLDLFTGSFTLLTGPDGAAWNYAAKAVSDRLKLTIDVHQIGHELQDPDKRFLDTYGITDSGVSLVRPDGFVAWRVRVLPEHPEPALRQILNEILALSTTN